MISVSVFLLSSSACKKCFHCYNECVQCIHTDSLQTLARTLCRDSFNSVALYNAAIAADTASGYICTSTASTYTYDFCVNKAGEETYPDYYNKGNKIKCDEK
jgi:hypothetical protein